MANRYSWNDVQQRDAENEARSNNGPYVGFFSLKNDKDEAIVRIMHDSPEDFDVVPVHPVTVDGKFANVACLRGPHDPLDMCPMCAAGKKFSLRMYIHLIQYTLDENGQIVASAKVWDRSTSYGKTLINFMNEYGPLSDCIFKIKRNGVAGSQETTYDIIPANPKVYTSDRYVKDDSLFEGYTALGTAVKSKTYEEMMQTVSNMPATETQAQPKAAPSYSAPVAPQAQPKASPAFSAPSYNAPQQSAPAFNAPSYGTPEQPIMPEPQTRPTFNSPASSSNDANGTRPRRYY